MLFIAHKAEVEPTVPAYLSGPPWSLARLAAKLVDEAIYLKVKLFPPLAGIPGAIKDNICIKEMNLQQCI